MRVAGPKVAAYEEMNDPVEVEHIVADGGIDIGGTDIGMHVKFVQVPVRLKHHTIGGSQCYRLIHPAAEIDRWATRIVHIFR